MLGFQLRQRGLCFGKPGRQIVHLCFQCRFRLGSCLGGGFGPFLRLLHRCLNGGFVFLLCIVLRLLHGGFQVGGGFFFVLFHGDLQCFQFRRLCFRFRFAFFQLGQCVL